MLSDTGSPSHASSFRFVSFRFTSLAVCGVCLHLQLGRGLGEGGEGGRGLRGHRRALGVMGNQHGCRVLYVVALVVDVWRRLTVRVDFNNHHIASSLFR